MFCWLPGQTSAPLQAKRRVLRANLSRTNVSKAVNSNYSPDRFLDLEAYLTQVLPNKYSRREKCFTPGLTEKSQVDPGEQAFLTWPPSSSGVPSTHNSKASNSTPTSVNSKHQHPCLSRVGCCPPLLICLNLTPMMNKAIGSQRPHPARNRQGRLPLQALTQAGPNWRTGPHSPRLPLHLEPGISL